MQQNRGMSGTFMIGVETLIKYEAVQEFFGHFFKNYLDWLFMENLRAHFLSFFDFKFQKIDIFSAF